MRGKMKHHNNKVFDKDLHDKYDPKGRKVAKRFFAGRGYIAKDNPDEYGIDLLLYKDGKIVGYADVEVKTYWNTVEYTWPDMCIPERKREFFEIKDLPRYFVMVNNAETALLYVLGQKILKKEIFRKDTRYKKNEPFFKFDIDEVTHVDLSNISF